MTCEVYWALTIVLCCFISFLSKYAYALTHTHTHIHTHTHEMAMECVCDLCLFFCLLLCFKFTTPLGEPHIVFGGFISISGW